MIKPRERPHGRDSAAWNRFVASHEAGSMLQTTRWGRLKSQFGWEWDLVTLGNPDTPTAGAVVLYRPLPLGLGTIAYVPRGPLVNWSDAVRVAELLDLIHTKARRRRAWACWLEPEAAEGTVAARTLSELDYGPVDRTIQPRSTILVDLVPDEDAILAAMKSKTRYNIRLSARRGVTVRMGTEADLGIFHDLMSETGERDAFGIHSAAYYEQAFRLFEEEQQVGLFLASYEDEPLAGILVFAVGGKAWYISGASSSQHRNLMPSYAVQWAAMRWAKAKGCAVYDLWGIPDADEATLESEFTERSDGLWGVYRFKRGFGGRVVRYTGMWEHALTPFYPLASWFYARSSSVSVLP